MADTIKTMKLYHQVDRVFNELSAMGIDDDSPLDVQTLCAFDQYHYLGTEAVDAAVTALDIDSNMEVLEVGGGIGGPSRHLAHASGCRMTALELQSDLNEVATQLTRRCDLDTRVEHVCGDILAGSPGNQQYDALVSWLTFLHIPDRPNLYARCHEAMKPGAQIYVEDYFQKQPLSSTEQEKLSREVYCDRVPTMDEYEQELTAAGFRDINLIDMSAPWTEFVLQRFDGFNAARERNLSLHGSEIIDGLGQFSETIVELFTAGNLGGIRFTASKPAT